MATEVYEIRLVASGGSTVRSVFTNVKTGAVEANRSILDMTSSLRFMRNALVALSFLRVFEGLKEGITQAQSAVNLFVPVTKNMQQASAAFDHFLEIAQETRAPVDEIAKLASLLSRTIADSPDKLGQVDHIVRNIAESFSIAGANGQTVRNVTRDIIEMFSGGNVIMRQFRAVLQQDRPLLDAISKSVQATGNGAAQFNEILAKAKASGSLSGGTLIEAIRAVPGALQGADVQRALSKNTQIEDQFKNTMVTLGQALTQLDNAWIGFLKHLNDATNGLNFLASGVQALSRHIPLIVAMGVAMAALLVVEVVANAFINFGSLIVSVFKFALAPVRLFTQAIIGLASPLISFGVYAVRALINLPEMFNTAFLYALRFSTGFYQAAAAVMSFGARLAYTLVNGVSAFFLTAASLVTGFTANLEALAAEGLITVIGSFRYLVSVSGGVLSAFSAMGSALVQLGSAAAANVGGVLLSGLSAVLETVLLLAPAIAGMIVAGLGIAAIGVAIYGLLRPLGQVVDAILGLDVTWGSLPAVVLATTEVIIKEWPLFTQTISRLWTDMINSMKKDLGGFGNEVTNFFVNPLGKYGKYVGNPFAFSPLAPFSTDQKTDTAKPLLDKLAADIKKQLPEAQKQIEAVVGPFRKQFFALINGTGDSAEPVDNQKYATALSSLDQLIQKVEPAAAAYARMAEARKVLTKAEQAGVDVQGELAKYGLTVGELMRREARDAVGAGNAATDYAGRLTALNTAMATNNITLSEHDILARKAQETFLKSIDAVDASSGVTLAYLQQQDYELNRNSVAAAAVSKAFRESVNPAIDYQTQITALTKALKDGKINQDAFTRSTLGARIAYESTQQTFASGVALAQDKFTQNLSNPNPIAADAVSKVFAHAEAINKYNVGLKAVLANLQKFPQYASDAAKAIKEMQIAMLDTNTDALSGFQSGLVQSQLDMNNFAATAKQSVTQAFSDMTDALTNFFQTGKFDIKQLGDDLLHNLDKLAVQQVFTGPLSNMLGFGQQGQGGGLFGSGGILGTIFGGLGLAQRGSTPANPLYVTDANLGNLLSGGSGSSGGLFGSGDLFGSGGFFSNLFNGGGGAGSTSSWLLSLLGFANGGSFMVGGNPGTDQNVVAFRASRGERVTVQTPSQQAGADANRTVPTASQPIELHLHLNGVSDYDSFKKSKGQITAGVGILADRALRRNGER